MNKSQMKEAEITDVAVFNSIVKFLDHKKYSPNMRELLNMTEIASKSTIHRSLNRLRDKDLIDFVDGDSRTIVVLHV